MACLSPKSSRPKSLRTIFYDSDIEGLRELFHQSPLNFDKLTSLWTLELAAQLSFEQGLSHYQVSTETIRSALKRLGKSWQRAKLWIVSPEPEYLRRKGRATD